VEKGPKVEEAEPSTEYDANADRSKDGIDVGVMLDPARQGRRRASDALRDRESQRP